jgi:hypothetical protein
MRSAIFVGQGGHERKSFKYEPEFLLENGFISLFLRLHLALRSHDTSKLMKDAPHALSVMTFAKHSE